MVSASLASCAIDPARSCSTRMASCAEDCPLELVAIACSTSPLVDCSPSAALLVKAVVQVPVRRRVEDQVRLVAVAAAGHRDVERLSGGRGVGQHMGGVGGHPLGAVHGRGVGQFHVPPDVVGGQRHGGRAGVAVAVEQPDGE